MTRLMQLAAALTLGLFATAALAAGGTSTTTAPSAKPKASTSTHKKKVTSKSTETKKKSASATTKKKKTEPVTVDAWADKYGDLGPSYIAAVKLADGGKYEDALAAFKALDKPEDPRVLNWIGFSLRKMGKVDEAMPYYEKALSIAPEFTPAYEYLGEAFLQLKDVGKAREQLAKIEKLCGNKTCEEYADLKKAIEKAAL